MHKHWMETTPRDIKGYQGGSRRNAVRTLSCAKLQKAGASRVNFNNHFSRLEETV